MPDAGNKSPDYPSELRDEGIEGEVVLKLHVYRDGTVKGAKILRVTSNVSGDEAKTRAEKLFKSAVIAAIRTAGNSRSLEVQGRDHHDLVDANHPLQAHRRRMTRASQH